ncbi:MAG: hypothetical protein ACFFED_16375 [Candidatus Thorarchaeota archaeon]
MKSYYLLFECDANERMRIVEVILREEEGHYVATSEELGLETRGTDADDALKKMRAEADRLSKEDSSRPTYEFMIRVK